MTPLSHCPGGDQPLERLALLAIVKEARTVLAKARHAGAGYANVGAIRSLCLRLSLLASLNVRCNHQRTRPVQRDHDQGDGEGPP